MIVVRQVADPRPQGIAWLLEELIAPFEVMR